MCIYFVCIPIRSFRVFITYKIQVKDMGWVVRCACVCVYEYVKGHLYWRVVCLLPHDSLITPSRLYYKNVHCLGRTCVYRATGGIKTTHPCDKTEKNPTSTSFYSTQLTVIWMDLKYFKLNSGNRILSISGILYKKAEGSIKNMIWKGLEGNKIGL